MAPDSGTELIRAELRAHTQGLFGLAAIASELRIQPHRIEGFLDAKRPLPPHVMHELVALLFHGKAVWDERTDTLRTGVVSPV